MYTVVVECVCVATACAVVAWDLESVVGSFEFAVVAAAEVASTVAVVVAGIEMVCTLVGSHSAND